MSSWVSGGPNKPVNAADLASVLGPDVFSLYAMTAILTAATPQDFADGILAGLKDPAHAAAVGRRARELADTKYSYEAYLERTRQACAALQLPLRPAAVVKDVA